ncbi:hypothetical protein VNI00_008877 [Paramarasmius palmivorus]|uniref:DUF6593 domain-containing protein n=1 Tax=Paramarasmius palmivorus TaxID=297713 RepID=A0AAW0AUA1_9AGAR
MDLIFPNQNTSTTTFTLSSGQALYKTSTDLGAKHSKTILIKKLDPDLKENGSGERDMAFLEIHKFHDDVCRVWGRDVALKTDGLFTSARSFDASDGKRYTWKFESSIGRGELKNASGEIIALSEKYPAQMKLTIEGDGLKIADDIVATFVIADQWARITNAGYGAPVGKSDIGSGILGSAIASGV